MFCNGPIGCAGGQACSPTPENLQLFMQAALDEVRQHDDAWPFQDPVDRHDVPDYYEVIKVLV